MFTGAGGLRTPEAHPEDTSMSDSSGKRAAAAAVFLVTAWIATYWLWEPREGESAGVVFDDAPPAAAVHTTPRATSPEPVVADPLTVTEPSEPDEGDTASGPRLVPPEFTLYTVRLNDDIMTIAKRLYGNSRHWQAIAKANPGVDPQRMRVGQKLLVPKDPGNIQGVVVDDSGAGEPPRATESERIEHVVQKNDSLWKIAAAFYGDGTKWTIIRDANRDLVGDEGQRLRPGMTLTIPAAPSRAQ